MHCNLQKIISDLTVLCAFALFLIQQYIVIFKRLKVQIKEYRSTKVVFHESGIIACQCCIVIFLVCAATPDTPWLTVTLLLPTRHCHHAQYFCTFYFLLVTLNSTIYKTFRSLTSASYSLDQAFPPP